MRRRPALTAYAPRIAGSLDATGGPLTVDGTVVSADLSGFTRLSERFADLGREGAERVTGAVNSCFAALIDEVVVAGGDVLKFGGDAILTLYTGERHADRAAAAARRMRHQLTRVGRFESPLGPVRLRMSVGMASGPVTLAPVGTATRDLIVLGPALDTTLTGESLARPGQIFVHRDTRSQLRVGGLRSHQGDWSLLLRQQEAEHPDLGGAADGFAVTSDPAAWVPAPIRELVDDHADGHDVPGGQHRFITVAFVRIEQLHADDPREVADLYALVEKAAEEHGATIIGTDADIGAAKVILTTGAPTSVDQPGVRLVGAIHDAVRGSVQCRAGAAQGVAYCGDVGHPDRRAWTVMGDVVNTAARLASAAPMGDALITRVLSRRVAHRFTLAAAPPISAKGKAEPLEAAVVEGRASGLDRRDERVVPLLGMQKVLNACRRSFDHRRVVVLVGPPGSGRTRLANELSATTGPVLDCSGAPHHGRRAWLSSRSLLLAALGRVPGSDSSNAPAGGSSRARARWDWLIEAAIGHSEGGAEQVDPSVLTERFAIAVLEGLERLPSPGVLRVDGLDDCDAASASLLEVAGPALARSGWHVVMTARRDPGDIEGDVVEIPRLGDDDIRALVNAVSPRPRSDTELRRIVEAADGSPGLAVVLGRELFGRSDLPGTVEGAITQRLDLFTPAELQMLRTVAVFGREPDVDLVVAVTGDDRWQDPVTLDAFYPVLRPTPAGWAFAEPLLQRVAELGLPLARRRMLHRSIAEELHRRGAAPGHVAYHAIAGQHRALQRQSCQEAADRAASRGAWDDALWYQISAARTAEEGATSRAWTAAGSLADRMGMGAEAERCFKEALSHATDATIRAEIHHKRASAAARGGWQTTRALRLVTQALNDMAPSAPGEITEGTELSLLLVRANAWFFQGHFRRAKPVVDEVLERARNAGLAAQEAAALVQNEMLLGIQGDLVGAAAAADRAVALFDALDEPSEVAFVHNNHGVTLMEAGRWGRALQRFERAAVAYDAAGWVVGAASARVNEAGILSEQGHWERAEQVLADVERIAGAAGSHLLEAFAIASLGRLEGWAGRCDAATERFERASAVLDRMGDPSLREWIGIYRAECALLMREPEHAAELLVSRSESAEASAGVARRRLRACVAAQHGDGAAARTVLQGALEIARREQLGIEIMLCSMALDALASEPVSDPAEVRAWGERLGVVRLPPLPPLTPV